MTKDRWASDPRQLEELWSLLWPCAWLLSVSLVAETDTDTEAGTDADADTGEGMATHQPSEPLALSGLIR